MNIIQTILQMWAKSEARNANQNMIAKHLSRIALYELKGIEALYPDLKDKYLRLEAKMNELSMPIKISETFRTAKKQDEYYNGKRKVTNARGLESYHQYGLAVDIIFKKYNWNAPSHWWDTLGKEGEKLGLEWGGHWGDKPHFKLVVPNLHWKELKEYFK